MERKAQQDITYRLGLARGRAECLHFRHHIHTVHDGAKHHVLAIKPRAVHGAQEELRVRFPWHSKRAHHTINASDDRHKSQGGDK